MDKIRYGKWGGWIAAVGMLLRLCAVITAQPGFLSISCGAKRNHTTENNITWVSDADYIDVGEIEDVGEYGTEEAYGSYVHSLRYFPKPLNKSCYQLPVAPHVLHLLRLWFFVGNSSNLSDGFAFSIETVETLAVQNISGDPGDTPYSYEYILATSGTTLYICLVRTLDFYDPFISAIELRRFEHGMYSGMYSVFFTLEIVDNGLDNTFYTVKPSMYALIGRYDLGGNSMVRYPHDKFDRIWRPHYVDPLVNIKNISTKERILTGKSSFNRPPTAVMQTAWVVDSYEAIDLPTSDMTDGETFLVLYFAEIVEMLNASKPRSFSILIDGENTSITVTLDQSFSVEEFSSRVSSDAKNFGLRMDPNSTLPPIINAYECYWHVGTALATYWQDIDALDAIKRRFGIKDWISDPCFLIPWKGIGCHNTSTSSPPRISKIDLSGRNLTGPVPNDIGQLTGLVSLSLDNNHFTGTIPNLTNLTMLERLYLQNNMLNGTLEWLSELKNLTEIYLQNNKFSGSVNWLFKLNALQVL